MDKTKGLSKDCKNIVLNLLKARRKNRGKCQISDECSNNERIWLDEMHIF
jgi:hypothetical protein